MISRIITLLLVAAPMLMGAQSERQAENWHFGSGISVSFESGTPVLNPPSSMEAFEGVVSMSDTTGQLLFYTNGGGRLPASGQSTGIIWNRNHEVMYDMRGEEGGGFSARQSAIAMPDPAGEAGVYYLFTMEEQEFDTGGPVPGQPNGRGLSYFIIDMNLNGGLGGVRIANQLVIERVFEALTATPMADGNGFWILCHSNDDGAPFVAVTPLTAAGVGTPVITPRPGDVGGIIRISPDGRFIWLNGKIYPFDPMTGTIGDAPSLRLPDIDPASITFTPDSRFLYGQQIFTALGRVLVRYDLSDGTRLDVDRFQRTAGEVNLQNAAFQIGPNGNIYFVEESVNGPDGPTYGLSEIVCASSPVPTVNRFLVDLSSFRGADFSSQSLPNYVDAIFAEPVVADTLVLDIAEVFSCNGAAVTLSAREFGTDYRWSDGTEGESLEAAAAATYCVTITGGCQPTVDCQTVIDDSPTVSLLQLGEEDRGCDGRFIIYEVVTTGRVDSVQIAVDYNDDDIDNLLLRPAADTIFIPARSSTITLVSTIFAPCAGEQTSISDLDLTLSDFSPVIDAMTADGEAICQGKDFTLSLSNQGRLPITTIEWFNGISDEEITVSADVNTDYFATVGNACGDEVRVSFNGTVEPVCDCTEAIPKVITPNADGTNDWFRIFSNCPPEDYTLLIFNRWGQRIFDTSNPDQGWDGTVDGKPQTMDTYLYRMVFRFPGSEEVEVREGQFTLVR